MDPLTAIGLAGNIINFIEFSFKVIAGGHSIANSVSGMTPENASLDVILDDLKAVTKGLLIEIPDLAGSDNEKELARLATSCYHLSKELSEILAPLRLSEGRSKWQGMKVKWRSLRKEKEIESIERRLNDFQSQILVRLHLMLRCVWPCVYPNIDLHWELTVI